MCLAALTVHVVLLPIPPQTHGDEGQQDEHHHPQNAAHDQVEQASGGAGRLLGVGAGWGDGVLAGRPRGLACCGREEREVRKVEKKKKKIYLAPSNKAKNNIAPKCKMQAIVVGAHKKSSHLCCVIMELMPVIKAAGFAETCLEKETAERRFA